MQYVLIMPESKLCIGVFEDWVHAYVHFRKLHESQQPSWFIVTALSFKHVYVGDSFNNHGWMKLDVPCALKPNSTRTSRNGRWPRHDFRALLMTGKRREKNVR